jgi:hypothetical protein
MRFSQAVSVRSPICATGGRFRACIARCDMCALKRRPAVFVIYGFCFFNGMQTLRDHGRSPMLTDESMTQASDW